MNLLTPKRTQVSPATTRHNTSTRGSVCSPNKNSKNFNLSNLKDDRFKALQYGSTWKQFILPQFKLKDLGQSISTINTPRKKQVESRFMTPRQVNQLTRFQTFGINKNENGLIDCSMSQNQSPNYLKQQADYLRDEMQKILIQKYKPGAKTLY